MTEPVDYASPLIKIDSLLRAIHDLCLHKDYMDATHTLNDVEYQIAVLRKNLIQMHMKELE